MLTILIGLMPLLAPRLACAQTEDNIGHARHRFKHGDKLDTQQPSKERFTTTRSSDVVLPLTTEDNVFTFLVFGDRTGGPIKGVSILADAVREANLLGPDFVINIGDMINGYNETPLWMEQMNEYKTIMSELLCPWFPVPGNHDLYWRGGTIPPKEHEEDYEKNFGPLWYAFEHKKCWFIVLCSDEGDPETGRKDFKKPASQKMSDAQFAWIQETLKKAAKAERIFVFLHHPRWRGGQYGDDWNKVHRSFVEAGNVAAVFAGHIHYMDYDCRDGIEYFILATTGANQKGTIPAAGNLHEYHQVLVRKDRISVAAIPVGHLLDPREITLSLRTELSAFAKQKRTITPKLALEGDGSLSGKASLTIKNTTTGTLEVVATGTSEDSRWSFEPKTIAKTLQPGAEEKLTFQIARIASPIDNTFRDANIRLDVVRLTAGSRIAVPMTMLTVPLKNKPTIEKKDADVKGTAL